MYSRKKLFLSGTKMPTPPAAGPSSWIKWRNSWSGSRLRKKVTQCFTKLVLTSSTCWGGQLLGESVQRRALSDQALFSLSYDRLHPWLESSHIVTTTNDVCRLFSECSFKTDVSVLVDTLQLLTSRTCRTCHSQEKLQTQQLALLRNRAFNKVLSVKELFWSTKLWKEMGYISEDLKSATKLSIIDKKFIEEEIETMYLDDVECRPVECYVQKLLASSSTLFSFFLKHSIKLFGSLNYDPNFLYRMRLIMRSIMSLSPNPIGLFPSHLQALAHLMTSLELLEDSSEAILKQLSNISKFHDSALLIQLLFPISLQKILQASVSTRGRYHISFCKLSLTVNEILDLTR